MRPPWVRRVSEGKAVADGALSRNVGTEDQFRVLVDSSPQSVIFIDQQGRVQSFNEAAQRNATTALGQSLQVGQPFRSYLRYSESIDYFFRALNGERVDFTTDLSSSGESTYSFALTFAPIFDSNGKQHGVCCLAQDISAANRLQQEHHRSQERLLALIENACDILRIEDETGVVTFISPAVKRVLKLRPTEVIGKKWSEFVHADDQHELKQHQHKLLQKNQTIRHQQRVRRKDGSWAHLECIRTLLSDDSGGRLVVVSSREVSERIHVEEGLRAARDRALEAAKLKTEFLANVSHEIRTPMNAIIGMTGLLLESDLTAEQKHYAQIVRRSAESLLGLINGILDFSKAESGTLKLASSTLDLRDVVEDVLQLLGEDAAKKNIELIYWADLDFPRSIVGDADKLRQILTNLVGNAVKFTSDGQITVRLKTKKLSGTNWAALVEVTDTGMGIPKEAQDQLFKAFSQVDGSATRKFGGTGLGLAICKQLVTLMGGKVGLVSEEGKGSRFWFTFPLKREQTPVARPEMPQVAIGVISENSSLGIGISRMLKDVDFQQVVVLTPVQALRTLESTTPFDVLLLDTAITEKAAGDLNSSIEARGVPVIQLVPFSQADADAMKLRKPVRRGELLEMLSRVVHVPAAATATSAETINFEDSLVELKQSMGDELATDLITLFVTQVDAAVDEIETSLKASDFGSATNVAERLVSGSSSLGFGILANQAKKLAGLSSLKSPEALDALEAFRHAFAQLKELASTPVPAAA